MVEKRINPRVVFLLVLLIAVGVFLLYSRLTFTGFVVGDYFTGSKILHEFSDNDSIFENTKFDGIDAVVLNNLTFEGVYTAPLFAAPNETEVIWSNFVQDIYYPPSSSAVFYYRACNDLNCTDVNFIPINLSSILMGKYFQYKVVMQTSGNSPKLYGVNIYYQTPLDLPVVIESPQNNFIYNNETVLLKITADTSAWFYNGTDNETYLGEMNRTFAEGNHIITAWVGGDAYGGNTNSTSVTFSVWFLKTYYRFANNACGTVTLTLPEKTANDYVNLTECQSKITTTTSTTTTEETTTKAACSSDWQCDDWGECVDGIQTRICTDMSTCTAVSEPPLQEQPCEGGIVTTTQPEGTGAVVSTEETPQQRGFLSIVGGAIATPFTYVFGNRTRIFIFLGVLVLVVGGFLLFKFSPEVKLRVLRLLNLRKRKVSAA